MDRNEEINKIKNETLWDILVIGGGASGLGVALDAVSRDLKTLLIDQYDFGKGTSSKSTKLVHGGVRYLEQGNIRLVREALKERDFILDQAPHNAHVQPFIIPFYSIWMGIFYMIGLKLYDFLAGSRRIGSTKWLTKNKVSGKLPNLKSKGLKGGILYFDGQFDDARMCIDLVKTIQSHNGICLNYMEYSRPIYNKGLISGGILKDIMTGTEYEIRSKFVVNATGVFSDTIQKMDAPKANDKIIPSRGSHIVLDKKFIGSDYAIMIPRTTDGRVLFAIPWNEKLIIGTTDVKTATPVIEPQITVEEVNFMLDTCRQYFNTKPTLKDVLAVYSGLRPLAAPDKSSSKTKEISRGHKIFSSESGLISIIGGKWTTFRKMGEDVIDYIEKKNKIEFNPSTSESIKIEPPSAEFFKDYPRLELTDDFIRYLIKEEMAMSVEDVLARRTRLLFLDAGEAVRQSKMVAEKMKMILQKDDVWEKEQIIQLNDLSTKFMIQDK